MPSPAPSSGSMPLGDYVGGDAVHRNVHLENLPGRMHVGGCTVVDRDGSDATDLWVRQDRLFVHARSAICSAGVFVFARVAVAVATVGVAA